MQGAPSSCSNRISFKATKFSVNLLLPLYTVAYVPYRIYFQKIHESSMSLFISSIQERALTKFLISNHVLNSILQRKLHRNQPWLPCSREDVRSLCSFPTLATLEGFKSKNTRRIFNLKALC